MFKMLRFSGAKWGSSAMAIGLPEVGWFPGLRDPTGDCVWPPAVVARRRFQGVLCIFLLVSAAFHRFLPLSMASRAR